MHYAFGIVSKKSLTQDQDSLLCLILRVLLYYVLCLHFESILWLMWGKTWSVFLHMDRQLSQDHLWQDCPFAIELTMHIYQKLIDYVYLDLFVNLTLFVCLPWYECHTVLISVAF